MAGVNFRALNIDYLCDGTPKGKYVHWRYAKPGWAHYRMMSQNLARKGKIVLAQMAELHARKLLRRTE